MAKSNVIKLPLLKWEQVPEFAYLGFIYMPFIMEKLNEDNGMMEQYVAHDVYSEDEVRWANATSSHVKATITVGHTEKFKYRFLKQHEFQYIIDDLIRKKELPYSKGYYQEWEF